LFDMLVIGEKINASMKPVADAIVARDKEFIANLARSQADAGADFVDVNAGTGKGTTEQQIEGMEWLIEVVQDVTDKPITIDSDVPDMIEAALKKYNGEKVMVNSISAEPDRLSIVEKLTAKHNVLLVALAMGDAGIPDNVEQRLNACAVIMDHVTKHGMSAEQIFFDPLVLPISVDPEQGHVTLRTIEEIKKRYPAARTVMGLSNVSYGLPSRALINRAFLLMAAYAGLDAVIIDPLDTKAMSLIKVADMLNGKDPYCKNYIRYYRKGVITG
jgi:5-methyltetrahydrofolate corrinoid/iron sulfur protein methyltransferase